MSELRKRSLFVKCKDNHFGLTPRQSWKKRPFDVCSVPVLRFSHSKACMEFRDAKLVLGDGSEFLGVSPLWQEEESFSFGEVVFTTGMTGYVEALTDPSYAGQILVFTYPLIGNYGVPESYLWESNKVQVRGVVVGARPFSSTHRESRRSFLEWLQKEKVPLISEVDTRALTKILRSSGTAPGTIFSAAAPAPGKFLESEQRDLLRETTIPSAQRYGKRGKTIILVDCGVKQSILRALLRFPIQVKQVPYDYDYTEEDYAGVFLSNGPGDPEMCTETIAILQKAMTRPDKPIFGICLGAQLMALACGAKTKKLHYGHRAHNQPCLHLADRRCYLTSQNHGYVVVEESLPEEWEVTFRNLNDGSVEGLRHKKLPFFAVQFHPEAAPGPLDTRWLFDSFYKELDG